MSAEPSWDQLWEGRDARVAGSPQGRDFRETFRAWGRQQGFHIWPGRTERAVRQGEGMEGLDSTGAGVDMLQAQPGAGAGVRARRGWAGLQEACTMWGLAQD